jgi:phenylpropionate dioxygenase-like ring-hydroxylating dioxygenase large terminal subunit
MLREPAADPILLNDWHPVAAAAAIGPGTVSAAALLGRELAIWRDSEGAVHAWDDRCPHRGTRLSIGRVEGGHLACAYHGWRFASDARCVRVPALPGFVPPASAAASAFAVTERYGLVWVCVGSAAHDDPPACEVPPFPEAEDRRLRKVVCGPYDVASSGPRIVENFLDMAHFAWVHDGILGEPGRAEVKDYRVGALEGGAGIVATQCFAWQPQTNTLAHGGSEVEYTYRVVRPLTAILTKVPLARQDFREAISLHVQPLGEEASRAWIVMAMSDFAQPEHEVRAFQDRIFLQDKPILENQRPRRLPLSPDVEQPVRSDRMSVLYRRYLSERGLSFGVIPAVGAIKYGAMQ